jgi:hypothetical protein
MTAMISTAAYPRERDATPAEIEGHRRAIVAALDRLFVHETPTRHSRAHLRLAGPTLAVLKADSTGEGLRLFLRSRGRDLYAAGGDEELMLAFSAVIRERPDRRAFNRTLLASLWSDIGRLTSRAPIESAVRPQPLAPSGNHLNTLKKSAFVRS